MEANQPIGRLDCASYTGESAMRLAWRTSLNFWAGNVPCKLQVSVPSQGFWRRGESLEEGERRDGSGVLDPLSSRSARFGQLFEVDRRAVPPVRVSTRLAAVRDTMGELECRS